MVKHERRDHLLEGVADYTFWYKSMGTPLVASMAKDTDTFGGGIPQCLMYLGIVHSIRKKNFNKNAILYGVFSDGHSFTFLRIDTMVM